jgi:two-component system heavy metal sensor histidine kinase CusS
LGLIVPILAAILGGSFLIYSLFKDSLYAELDHFLSDKLHFHQLSLFQNERRISYSMSPERWKALYDLDHPEYYHYRFHKNQMTIMKSPGLKDTDLPKLGFDSNTPAYQNITLPSDIHGRAAGLTFFPNEVIGTTPPKRLHLVIVEDASRILAALQRLKFILLSVSAIATAFVIYTAARLIRRNLRPLDQLAEQIEAVPVSETDTSNHFALTNAPSELDPVVTRMNILMDRVNAAIQKERQFTANAAHELRNPLAGIRSQLELALAQERTPAEYQTTLSTVLSSEKRLEQLVENLLLLTKLEAGLEDTTTSTVSLPDLLRRSWKPCFETAEQKSLSIKWNVHDSAKNDIQTCPHLFRIIISNIFQNAVTHAPQGDTITISAKRGTTGVCISVSNAAPGLTKDDLPKIFERFWRATEAREQNTGNVGIGLSLCKRISATLGGSIDATLTKEQHLTITTCLPTS